ncbi:protein ECT2-like isoform X3 [Haemaphysalis longicornis]
MIRESSRLPRTLKPVRVCVHLVQCHGLPVVFSDTGVEHRGDWGTVFVLEHFEGPLFEELKHQFLVLSPLVLIQCAQKNVRFPDKGRPIYNLAMDGVSIIFTGFDSKTELCTLLLLCHYMGATVRRSWTSGEVTHCVSDSVRTSKYETCLALEIPVMDKKWVWEAWAHRDDIDFSATSEHMMRLRLGALKGIRLAFLGFAGDEQKHMEEVAIANGALVVAPADPGCRFLVIDDSSPEPPVLPPGSTSQTEVVQSEWFWICIQDAHFFSGGAYTSKYAPKVVPAQQPLPQACDGTPRYEGQQCGSLAPAFAHEANHEDLFPPESSRRKQQASNSSSSFSPPPKKCPQAVEAVGEGPEKTSEQPDLSRMSKRQQVCLELLQTETNYVAILHAILTLFKAPLEELGSKQGAPLLDATEVELIFGHLPPIYEVHRSLQQELQAMLDCWSEEHPVAKAVLTRCEAFGRLYPPYVNSYEHAKRTLVQCEQQRPRFHAFLKRCQTKPVCGRQSLAALMIRPIQRLGSMALLLKELKKRTPEDAKDFQELVKAVVALGEVLLKINEDKRKAESQMAILDIFNDIENCPPDFLSGKRHFVSHLEAVKIGVEGGSLSCKSVPVTLFLFSDVLEVCRRRTNKATPSSSGTSTPSTVAHASLPKAYKHLHMVQLCDIRRVSQLDPQGDSDIESAFGLALRPPTELQESRYTFVAEQPAAVCGDFLRVLCQHTAKVHGVPDHAAFLTKTSAFDLGLVPAAQETTLAKALKYAGKKGERISRALSATRRVATPKHQLSRAASTTGSPMKFVDNQAPRQYMQLGPHASRTAVKHTTAGMRPKSSSYGPSTSKATG